MSIRINEWMKEWAYHPPNTTTSGTYTLSFVDLMTSEVFSYRWGKGVINRDVNDLKDLLYCVGVNKDKPLHIERKLHRPLSSNKIVDDYLIYYYPRTDKWWLDNHAPLEQQIDASERSFRKELLKIKNDPSFGDVDGGFREMSVKSKEEKGE